MATSNCTVVATVHWAIGNEHGSKVVSRDTNMRRESTEYESDDAKVVMCMM